MSGEFRYLENKKIKSIEYQYTIYDFFKKYFKNKEDDLNFKLSRKDIKQIAEWLLDDYKDLYNQCCHEEIHYELQNNAVEYLFDEDEFLEELKNYNDILTIRQEFLDNGETDIDYWID